MSTEFVKAQLTHWDGSAQAFDQANGRDGLPVRQVLVDPTLMEMLGNVTGKIILDGGCGNGYLTEKMAELEPAKVIGVDFSPAMIHIATEKSTHDNTEYCVASLTEPLSWIPDDSVDIAVFSLVLNYLPDLEILGGELQRIIRPGGRVLLAVESPLVNAHYRAQQLLRGAPDEAYGDAVPYNEETSARRGTQIYTQHGERINRPYASYMQLFFQGGFPLTDFREPQITEEVLEVQPNYAPIQEIPRFTFMEFTKIPAQ